MKRFTTLFLFVFVLAALPLMAFAPMPSNVRPVDGSPDVLHVILTISFGFVSLGGASALVAALVSLGKAIGIVADSTSARWAAGLNLLMFTVLVLFGVFRPEIALDVLDGYAGQIAQALLFILGFIVQMIGSKPVYDWLRAAKIPLLGKSYSQ
jgi:hypothetical protein